MEVDPFTSDNLGMLYKIVPVKSKDEMTINWYFKEAKGQNYKSEPMSYISNLLGHEGPNSLLSSLIKDHLATELSSGYNTIASSFSFFNVKISLTKKGLKEYEEVLRRAIYLVKTIQNHPINKQFFEEIQNVSQLSYDFKNKENPTNYTCHLSPNLLRYDINDALSAGYLIETYDEKLIKDTINQLTLSNMTIYLHSQDFKEECTLKEPIYGTNYYKTKCPTNIVEICNSDLKDIKLSSNHILDYPPSNNFIPKDFSIHEVEGGGNNKYPKKILDDGKNVVWFKQDDIFKLPKAIVYVQVYFNAMEFLPYREIETISYIWSSIFENEIREIKYMADLAKVDFNINFNYEGLIMTVTGFNSSIQPVLKELISLFKTITAEGKHTNLITQIENYNKNFINFYYSPPYSQAGAYIEYLIKDPSTNPEEKQRILSSIDLPFLENYVNKYLRETRFEWIIQGNIVEKQAQEIADSCHKILQDQVLTIDRTPIYRIANIQNRVNYVFTLDSQDVENVNSCLISYFQFGNLSRLDILKLELLNLIFKEDFFNELRTKQALGYICQMYTKKIRRVAGLYFVVQSLVKCPEYVWQKINEFIADGEKTITEISDDKFNTYVSSLTTELKKKDLKLSDEANRNYFQVKNREFIFDIKEVNLELIKTITKQDMITFYLENVIKDFKRLDVEVLCLPHKVENEEIMKANFEFADKNNFKRVKVCSVSDFKKKVPFFEDFMSY